MVIISGVPIFRIFTVHKKKAQAKLLLQVQLTQRYFKHQCLKVPFYTNIIWNYFLFISIFQLKRSQTTGISKKIFWSQKIFFEIPAV